MKCVVLLLIQLHCFHGKELNYSTSTGLLEGCRPIDLEVLSSNFSSFEEKDCTAIISHSSCCFLSSIPEETMSGIYKVEYTTVYCHTNGWMTFMKRSHNRNMNKFNQTWSRYTRKKGFGVLPNDHWKGLKLLHTLTHSYHMELRIEVWNSKSKKPPMIASYDSFLVGSASSDYKLTLGQFTGPDLLQGFSAHNNTKFATPDHDSSMRNFNCAHIYGGGWWYTECFSFLPTGVAKPIQGKGLSQFDSIEMKIRPKDCSVV